MIKGLHHNAYRCRDSEATREFYEDFLGLELSGVLEIGETKTGRNAHALHSFFKLGDGSYLAFFEVPDQPFEFKTQHDFDLHIALEIMLRQVLTIGTADLETARRLDIPVNAPVGHMARLMVDGNARVIYAARLTYRGDLVRLDMKVDPPQIRS